MIVTVTANPALDVTYGLAEPLRIGGVHRVRTQLARPGGKGVNVARVLRALDVDVLAMGMSGGPGGAALRDALDDDDVPHEFVDCLPDVRRTVVVHDGDGTTTSLWESGCAPIDPRSAERDLIRAVKARVTAADAVTISGSNPPHVDPSLPARLARVAAQAGAPVIADLSGEALHAAVESAAAVVMPNVDELAGLAGHRIDEPADVAAYARELVAQHGLPGVVATLGSNGMIATAAGAAWWARPPRRLDGNPTGAGDAACAGIARHLADGQGEVNWPDAVTDAVALSAASVLAPVAGQIDYKAYLDLKPAVVTEPI